jgi:hypothetical protein
MACRGVFFALSPAQKEKLLSLETDQGRLDYLQEGIEAAWDERNLLQTDKAWDAIHRCLAGGSLVVGPSPNPLSKVILGGTQLYSDTQSYIINLVEEPQVPEVAAALKMVTKEWLKNQYDALRHTDYPRELISDQDWEYTWDWFSGIPEFFVRAAQENRSVIFSVDQ